jgi:hypothetical protein
LLTEKPLIVLREVLILGFYPAHEMTAFVQEMTANYSLNIRYLQVE